MNNKRLIYALASMILVFSLVALVLNGSGPKDDENKTDDWVFTQSVQDDLFTQAGKALGSMGAGGKMPSSPSNDMGFSVGGAKDINNFRRNVEDDYLPLATDVTYEGLFYDYYFDTNKKQECEELFCPSYSYAFSNDPISGQKEKYLSVGLNSNLKEEDFERKKLNLVVVLDISGSMGSSFSKYYYDQSNLSDRDMDKSKMQVASEALVSLTKHLKEDDRFAVVLYNSQAHLAKPLNKVGETDMQAIEEHIKDIKSGGGTRMSAGMKKGTSLFDEYLEVDRKEYENRIIFLTDAMPNLGTTSKKGLLGITSQNAKEGIYTTFIGIGVDFNTRLIENITKIRGANYYSVHSPSEFKERMDDHFDYILTPLVFNLSLKLNSKGYEIKKVYGSPEANEATGQIMKVNTLFPSPAKEGKTKGGIILLKLKRTSSDPKMSLWLTYEDRNGKEYESKKEIKFSEKQENHYQNSGIRKAIVLSRYADLCKNWIIDERKAIENNESISPRVNEKEGIVLPPEDELGKWERQSVRLRVSDEYRDLFSEFKKYYEKEMDALGDESMSNELSILKKLSQDLD